MNNMDSPNPVEQLWYTWSDVGLSTIHAGLRIRAASPGLTEIYSERVKSMERNMRYFLPPGANRFAVTPEMAPVGLAFVRSEWNNEYLLIHKNYLGEDGVGRSGNFFVHVLALGENSSDFSTEDAIWRWEADIWKTNSESLDRRTTTLNPLSIEEVDNSTTRFRPENFRQVQDALQFVIEAYLMRKDKDRNIPIYIAAPANQVAKIAAIIAGLTNCLPAQLFSDLTFSTYEPDITKATTEIVGTSWIPIPGQEAAPIFPPNWYREKLAVNCATHEKSNLQSHPQILYDPLAADFAAFAVECLTTGAVEQLHSLREYAETSRSSDSAFFLQLYYNQIVNTGSMDEVTIEKYLNSDLCANWLSQKNSRKKVIDCAIANPLWSNSTLYNTLLALRGQAERESATATHVAGRIGTLSTDSDQVASIPSLEFEPRKRKRKDSTKAKKAPATLANALASLAESMIPEVKKQMVQAHARQGKKVMPSGAASGDYRRSVDTVAILTKLMESCLFPQDPGEAWKRLFETIEQSQPAVDFLTSEWSIQSRLLRIWNNTFPSDWQDNDRMRPFVRIPWSHLGDFLHLGLQSRHPQWVVFPIEELIPNPNGLTPQIAKELERKYSREMGTLLTILDPTKKAYLIIRLVEKGYSINSTLDQQHIEALAKQLLTTIPTVGQQLVETLIQYDLPRNWLVDLYLEINNNQVELLSVIQYVYPKPEKQNEFFLRNGSRYLGHEEYVQSMLALYWQILPLDSRLQRLFILLNSLADTNQILDLLTRTPLDADEQESVLRSYGQKYLQNFQHSPQLANIVVKYFTALVHAGYARSADLFFTIVPISPPLTGGYYLEQLLSVTELTRAQQASFLEQYGATYISYYAQKAQMTNVMNYISTYIEHFDINALERPEANSFFAFLTKNYKNLALDTGTAEKIEWWQIINNYFNNPGMERQRLQGLARALFSLKLPNNQQFTKKLARAFFFCVQTPADVSAIMEYMRAVPKVGKEKADEYKFLYTLAEEAAEQALDAHKTQSSVKALTPYLIFALDMPSNERSNHFFNLFLDKLLYHVDVLDATGIWSSLTIYVGRQGLRETAIARWYSYLDGLGIGDKINAQTKSQQSPKSNIPPERKLHSGQASGVLPGGVNREKSSWLQRFLPASWSKTQAKNTPLPNGKAGDSLSAGQSASPQNNAINPSIPGQVSPVNSQRSDTQNNNTNGSALPGGGLTFRDQRHRQSHSER